MVVIWWWCPPSLCLSLCLSLSLSLSLSVSPPDLSVSAFFSLSISTFVRVKKKKKERKDIYIAVGKYQFIQAKKVRWPLLLPQTYVCVLRFGYHTTTALVTVCYK